MELIIIIVIAFFVIRYFKKKKADNETPVAPAPIPTEEELAALPADLAELRKLRDKAKWGKDYAFRRRICEVGMELYDQGKIVANPGNANDVGKLLGDMLSLIKDAGSYTHYPNDDALKFRCLCAGEAMIHDFNDRKREDPTINFNYPVDFSEYSWPHLAEFYAEGKYCPRNAGEARKFLRMLLTYQTRGKKEVDDSIIEQLMEVIAPGEDGKSEIRKWISINFGLGALKIKQGQTYRNFRPQTLYQAAELLFELDTDAIGSNDVDAMLDAYRRGAEAGNAYAQYMLGQYYLKGRFVEKDEAKGVELLTQAGKQRLYLAVSALSWHYHWIAHPYAGDHKGASKQEIAERERVYNAWSKRCDEVSAEVEQKYAPILAAGFSDGAADVPTRNVAQPVQQAAPVVEKDDDDEYVGRLGTKDSESPFTPLSFPDVMTGPYGVTYRRQSISINSADYWGDDGNSTTIHLADLGATGRNARNSDGYFYW